MKVFGIQRLTGILLAAAMLGAPLASPVLAQEAAPPAVEATVAETTVVETAPEAAPAAAAPAEEEPTLDTGDTSWLLTSTALVLAMTIPGLALFYGGMVRGKNVISTVAQCFAITAVISVVWMVAGYSLAFSENSSAALNPYVGGLSAFLLNGISMDDLSGTIPQYLFVVFQMTFAVITPALIVGAFAERMKFSAILLFMVLWSLIVYSPVCHWVWGGGFLSEMGVLDFAGGTVVHINAGIAGLVCALVLGKRKGFGAENMAPHNLVLTMIGASLLWVGWFGFNAGSAVGANGLAAVAMLNTQVATAGATVAWMIIEWVERKKPGMLGLASGAVAGLVAITPAAGFVTPQGALIIGLVGGGAAYAGAVWLKKALKYDDSLDVFGVHGIAGIAGALLTGVLASSAVAGEAAEGASIVTQFVGILGTIVWCAIATFAILMICKFTVGLRVSEDEEVEGLDLSQHGESLHH
ncbi:ammonium transporter [Phenylobacterium sp. SCN 70-31]|uniref:ammonium transporter n=1 Tax=Phenylobacterium sp. SCN 70-31 TaxID=1660129 RepID=UPI0025EB5553|nr:ammonium transporter [Phenylobacterium sp. SCN 70-31]